VKTIGKIAAWIIAAILGLVSLVLVWAFLTYPSEYVMRGIRWGVVSTTLLGMVDAAIGGKTGINHRNGKNLIGAFWQPAFVICDVRFLRTLSTRQLVAGLGEVLKYGGLVGTKRGHDFFEFRALLGVLSYLGVILGNGGVCHQPFQLLVAFLNSGKFIFH